MDKTVRKVTDLAEQQAETYRYWQSVSDSERMNATATYKALAEYGAYLGDAIIADFAKPGTIFQIGVAPFRIDLICDVDGLTFEEAWETSDNLESRA